MIEDASSLATGFAHARVRPLETQVLMADPRDFEVSYVINPHMKDHVGGVDRALARRQWQALADTYRQLGFAVHVLAPAAGLPDLVFTANQSLPVPRVDGSWFAIRSQMHAPERAAEVAVVARWYAEHGIETLPFDHGFEGMGDALWVPGRQVLLVGHGFRTTREAVVALEGLVDAPVLALELCDPRFYHLDTCLAPLNEHTALWVPDAFTPRSQALLQAAWTTLIEVPLHEAESRLACNGHCPDGQHFIVQSGATVTAERVRQQGLKVIEVETSEFLKSGGSVFCLKLMLPGS